MATALLVAIGLTGGTMEPYGQFEHEGAVQGIVRWAESGMPLAGAAPAFGE